MSYTTQDILDIAQAYYADPDRNKLYDASRPYQNYTLCNFFFGQKKSKPASDSFTWNILTGELNNAQASGLYAKDTLNRNDVMTKATGRWHQQKTHVMFDKFEPAMQSKSEMQIYDYMDAQHLAMYNDFYKFNEDLLGTLPAASNDGSSGEILPYGLPFHLAKNTTTAAFGHNGSNASGYSTTCGLDKSTNSNLKHGTGMYAGGYDLEDKLNDATDLCDFQSPYEGAAALGEQVLTSDFSLISTRAPFKTYQDLLYSMNDNIGPDAGKFRSRAGSDGKGTVYYKGIPWSWCSSLSKAGGVARDLREPVYGLKKSTWEVYTQNGIFLQRDETRAVDDAHTVFKTFFDTFYQLICKSYRDNFVLCASTASNS